MNNKEFKSTGNLRKHIIVFCLNLSENMIIYINARFLTQPITGVQRFAIEISKQLKILMEEHVLFVSPSNIIHNEIAKELGVSVIGKRKGHLWEQIDLPNYLKKKGNPLLINLANTGPVFYKNKFITIHDIAFNVYPETYSKSFLYFYKLLIPNLIRTSKHVITVSNFSKQEIIKYYKIDNENISVIYNAVNASFIKNPNEELLNKQYILAVSSINHRKNLLGILKAFKKFLEKNMNITLYVIGDLETKSFANVDLTQFITNNNIKILGRVSDEELMQFYSNTIGFIYPSFYEGFGIPPLEAQRCGCPILISNISCFPEIFKDSAIYCDPYSTDSIMAGIEKLVDNNELCQSLKAKGFENANRYSWEHSALKLKSIIDYSSNL